MATPLAFPAHTFQAVPWFLLLFLNVLWVLPPPHLCICQSLHQKCSPASFTEAPIFPSSASLNKWCLFWETSPATPFGCLLLLPLWTDWQYLLTAWLSLHSLIYNPDMQNVLKTCFFFLVTHLAAKSDLNCHEIVCYVS